MTEVQEINPEGKRPHRGAAEECTHAGGEPGGKRPETPRIFTARRIILLAIFLGGFAGFFAFDLGSYISFDALKQNREWLLDQVEAHRIVMVLGFMAIYAAVVAFSVPVAAITSITGGFLFGVWLGTLWNVIGASTGAILLFLAARSVFADILHAKAGPWLQKIEAEFNENAFSYLLFLRFVPIFPFFAVNLAPAFLGVRLSTYAITTVIGIIPGGIVYSLFGAGLGAIFDRGEAFSAADVFTGEIVAGFVGLAVLSLLPILIKMWRTKRAAN